MSVLDCGCGPGVLTCDIAERILNGRVLGIDLEQPQIKIAEDEAKVRQLTSVRFQQANVYDLESIKETFDSVFSQALLEHLKGPSTAIKKFHWVLKSGVILSVCSPDLGGFLPAPSSNQLNEAIEDYKNLHNKNDTGNIIIIKGGESPVKIENMWLATPTFHLKYIRIDPNTKNAIETMYESRIIYMCIII